MVGTAECELTVHVDDLDDDALMAQLHHSEVSRRHLEAVQAATIAEIARRGLHRVDGHASVAGLVRVVTKRPTWEVTQLVQTGRLMHEQPVVAEALGAGTLGVAQVHLLARARAHPRCGTALVVEVEALVEAAQRESYSSFKTRLADWVNLADADGANRDADASHERRDAFFGFVGDQFHGQIQAGTLDGVALQEIFDRFVQAEWEKDWASATETYGADASASKLPRTNQQRRFDALAAIFEASVSTPPDAQAPEPVVNVVVDQDTFLASVARWFGVRLEPDANWEHAGSIRHRYCHTSTGAALSTDEMMAAALAGHVRRVVLDSRHVVIDMGRKQRLFTGHARVAAHMNLPRCIWPGCELPAQRCQTDHLTNWSQGGHTRPEDGAPCCARHNLFKNRGYRIARDERGCFHTFRPDGTEIA